MTQLSLFPNFNRIIRGMQTHPTIYQRVAVMATKGNRNAQCLLLEYDRQFKLAQSILNPE